MLSITLRNLTKRFGEKAAVDSVSIDIRDGEIFFLLGPSGCGKTTLLRLLAGFYSPDEGRILFDGRDVSGTPPHERNVGMVFQNYALWPHMDVSANLRFGLDIRKLPEEEKRVRINETLEMVRMSEYSGAMPNRLSGGQQQRVALARALVLRPGAVLLDEPLSNLDANLRLRMRDELTSIQRRTKVTMVYVTHDQTEALSMADRLAVMDAGRIIQIGTPREVYERPGNVFVANFIGEANLLEGEVAAVGEEVAVDTPAGRLISAVFPKGVRKGEKITCAVRPERLRPGAGGEGLNVFRGKITRIIYLGSHARVSFQAAGAALDGIIHDTTAAFPETGSEMNFHCRREDVFLLRD